MPLHHDPVAEAGLTDHACLFNNVAGHIVQGKQAAMLYTSSDWPHAISLALLRLMASFLDLRFSMYPGCFFDPPHVVHTDVKLCQLES